MKVELFLMALRSLLLGQNRTVTIIICFAVYIIKILVIAIQSVDHQFFLLFGCLDFPHTEIKASKKVNFLCISSCTLLRLVHHVLMLILRGGFHFEDAT